MGLRFRRPFCLLLIRQIFFTLNYRNHSRIPTFIRSLIFIVNIIQKSRDYGFSFLNEYICHYFTEKNQRNKFF